MKTRKGRAARSRAQRGSATLVRKATDVRLFAEGVGYIRMTKVAARKLLFAKGDRLTLQPVPELGMLLIDPRPP